MSLDRLDRATRALRETTLAEGAQSSPAALERVLDRLDRPKPRARLSMRHVRIAAITLATSLLGVGAWANVTGRVHWFAPEPASAPPSEPAMVAPATPREHSRENAKPRIDAPPELPFEAPPEPVQAPLSTAAPAPRIEPPKSPAPGVAAGLPRRLAPPRLPERPAPSSARTTSDADVLYRAAHEAHFARADYSEAVALWDRYLAAAEPGHRWKIEARYNRGIALYRLGQTQLAREALEPFANGEYGAYRRADARRLLEAMPRSD